MATTIEQIQADIQAASAPGFRGRLLARGQARSMIWRDGALPANAPEFSALLSYDLQSYGYSLLGLGLRLLDLNGDATLARSAFEQAATALESVISNGDPTDRARDFHYVMAAAAYHLGRFSARAYSLLIKVQGDDNFSPIEVALCHLMLRNLDELERLTVSERLGDARGDAGLAAYFQAQWEHLVNDQPAMDSDGNSFVLDGLDLAVTDNFYSAISIFLLALERGDQALVVQSIETMNVGLRACADLNLIPQWWNHRVAIRLLGDLWSSSFHQNLPLIPAAADAASWQELRSRFLALLLRRKRAEIDLWPSQIAAAARAVNQSDDLVVSLPTGAGKTRIAELCILRCLAAGRRIVFVTPLRSLSAQTEIGLQRTFAPLGKTVSALYGSIGVSGVDEDALRERNIVVATPEKLDFALRNDPSLLDDVGLIVLDEGHMIGLSEREVRYEVQIQRLLKRPDANQRRIVCLSAILPEGDQLDDFANWLRRDQPGGLVSDAWRPTRLRYGEVVWNGTVARLNLRVGDERPFVPRFLTARIPPIGRRRTSFPKNMGELCLATAWRLVGDGQTVLVFCPVRAHVEPFADRIIDLHARGALPSLFTGDANELETALVLGREWLGENHPILQCLRLGVAIHHGALPTAFRKEIERLLRTGVLKVTISSPTLAQGLNLTATAVIIHSLFRNRDRIDSSEFKNVVGRAGRAFVDVEGLVLYPIFDDHSQRLRNWEQLIAELGSREMESGLVQLVLTLIQRMHRQLGRPPLDQLVDYVLNNVNAWNFPELPAETADQRDHQRSIWNGHLATLDTAILSLLGEQEIPDDQIAARLDEILGSSLWERRLNRKNEGTRSAIKNGLLSRAQYVFANSTARQRRGYFLAGVGLNTGRALDGIAPVANELLVEANGAMLNGDEDAAIAAITAFAEMVFEISPFVPNGLPENWREILNLWLRGSPIAAAAVGQEDEALQFVEGGLIYRLPWAMEAVRVRGVANGDAIGDFTLEDVELGLAVAAVETGTLDRSAALLMQAGFNSRLAAIKAVQDTGANFTSGTELRQWLNSDAVIALTEQADWPTPETARMWLAFWNNFTPRATSVWSERSYSVPVAWSEGADPPPSGQPVRIHSHPDDRDALVLSANATRIGRLDTDREMNPERAGLVIASVLADRSGVEIKYTGPDDLWLA
jgi:superfamily II DNA/RNA helicase